MLFIDAKFLRNNLKEARDKTIFIPLCEWHSGSYVHANTRPAEAVGLLGLWPYHILGSVIT